MEMISVGRPASASAGAAGNGNDRDYDSTWSVSGSGWLAYDLSSVPADKRSRIVLAWYTSPDDGHSVDSMLGVCPTWSGRPYLSNYTVEVNPAAGGGAAPTSGWVTAASVSGNTLLSRQHLVDFAGHNWIRVRGSGPNGVSINIDVADASHGTTDGWLFLGDSITAAYAGHYSATASGGATVRSFTDLAEDATSGRYRPIAQNSGTSCAKSYDALTWIDPMLAQFPGRYVTLNFGTNDGWAGSGDPAAFHDTMLALADKVTAAGKVPVIPTIPWPNNTGAWQTGTEALNDQIRLIYQQRPAVVPGPDLYTLTKNKTNLFRSTGDVHPNDAGAAAIRRAWAQTAAQTIYQN